MAVGFPTKTTYANGDVFSASDINDTNGTINLLTSSTLSMAAGKNTIINGNFDIWQRGTSFTVSGYTCDRWYGVWTGTVTVSRQSSGAPVGSQYYVRHLSGLNNSIVDFWQYIETANVIPIQGKTVVLSFKLRRNATLVSDFAYYVQKSATVDAGIAATWTTFQTGTFANASIPTGTTINDWYSASASFTIPTDGTANSIRIIVEPAAQMPNGASYDLAQVQLEIGSVPTTFTRAGGSIQGELAACQRYYQRFVAETSFGNIGQGFASTTTLAYLQVPLKTTMRVSPTVFDRSGCQISEYNAGFTTGTFAIYTNGTNSNIATVSYTHGSAALTQYRPYVLNGNGTTDFIGFGAEL